MASHISVVFEKSYLSTSGQTRIITRLRDDGSVPPQPSTSYFPTDPDSIGNFLVSEFISAGNGEDFLRVASLSDQNTLSLLTLNQFQDLTTDFVAAGVTDNDILEITLPDDELWLSDEFPSGSPFQFSISAVNSSTLLEVTPAMPAFATNLQWSIPARALVGLSGTTLRTGTPSNNTEYLETRFNHYFSSGAAAEAFVTATKSGLQALVNESSGQTLTTETITVSST